MTLVEDGVAAVEAVSAHRDAGTPFDAIFMDVQMPLMNGIEAVAAIRALEGDERHTYIAGLSGFKDAEIHAQCLKAGMDDFLTKPVSQTVLKSKLQNCLRERAAN